MNSEKPTAAACYAKLDEAYQFLNSALFEGTLPKCFINLQRHRLAVGYYAARQFTGRHDPSEIAEIALNPNTFVAQTELEILSTLAHEMAHCWQYHFGRPGRRGYHNREWAKKMPEIGLHPSTTGQPGGDETGERVSHYILPGGKFQMAAENFLRSSGFQIDWQSKPSNHGRNKQKFSCLRCEQSAWAKPSTKLICGICQRPMDRC